ncbi:HD domain-containing protein [Eubacteriales bacterium OttesenSCG-928-N13]|nr:HD domain-containing protein [Eubacteriales bacterium OttesenSCG-928-N13]
MKAVFCDIPFGITHTLSVLENAETIMNGENVSDRERNIITLSAILHDIGAVLAKEKYDSIEGRYQEMEGPGVAREILENHDCEPDVVDRVCYIVGNHHTPERIDGLDFQILWEADQLENLKHAVDLPEQLKDDIKNTFKTKTGYGLVRAMQ